ncbi:transglutaminase family protein [Luteimonas huabeiensis]|uniref:transglutaminase family protein n=1 Tax=Luteimonas huabeiensis TaxID=1244513 RepID=UPI0006938785|nr:transglutaminase family protein [Luteimonas huabeiensis]
MQQLQAQFDLPEQRVSYLDAKLLIDSLIDPSTDTLAIRHEIAAWERAVRAELPPSADARETLDALLRTLYQPGPWNQHRPFTYDFDDLLGRNPASKRLATYLATRKGNCVSMPILVAILGQRFQLPIALATAPHHVLVKFGDEAQQAWLNVEATAGGFKWDESYERETGITATAIENGLYLRPLTPREGVGVIAGTLMEHYATAKDGDALMQVADLVLAVNPADPVALVWKANAYYIQLQTRFVQHYPDPAHIPPEQVAEFHHLSRQNLAWFAKAEALGWSPRTAEQESSYLQSIQREKAQRGQ